MMNMSCMILSGLQYILKLKKQDQDHVATKNMSSRLKWGTMHKPINPSPKRYEGNIYKARASEIKGKQ